jgi:mannose-6-phosphate isomerase-like protein (cupin superfamily)
MDFKNYIVPKPWGYEYLIFENEKIGIWWLHLREKESTSLHCHPDKKTGLILLRGEAKVSFLSDTIHLNSFSKIMIREGFFHSTQALSKDGIDVIEIEVPKNKENLVRMADVYGRKGKSYESIGECIPKKNGELWIEDKIGERKIYQGYEFCVKYLTENLLDTMLDEDIIIILSQPGGIVSKDGFTIAKVGDTIKIGVVKRLLYDFEIQEGAYVLAIRRD